MKAFPTIGLMQGLSMIIVSATIGVATFLLFKSIKDFDFEKNKKIFLYLPAILPAVALGLLLSGWIMKNFPIIGLMQGLSMIIVSATIGLATFLLFKSIKGIDFDKHKKMIFSLPIVLPLIALGIVISSWILQGFSPIKNPVDLLIVSAVIGLSVLFFVPTILLLGKMDLKQIGKGVLAIPMIAIAIVASSLIFQLMPTDMRYPDWKWVLSTGLSIGIFGLIALGVGYLANLNPAAFGLGLLSVVALSGVIWLSSLILNKGKYEKYPDVEWAKGLGLSLLVFGVGALALGLIAMTGGGAVVMLAGIAAILVIAAAMLAVDAIFKLGDFVKYPSETWAKGVGKSMLLFSSFGAEGSPGVIGAIGGAISGFIKGVGGAAISATMIPIAMAMVAVDNILNKGSFTKYPSEEWAKGIGKSMLLFSSFGATDKSTGFLSTLGNIGKGLVKGVGGSMTSATMIPIANAMLAIDKIFSQGSFTKYPTTDWANNVTQSINAFSNIDAKANSIRNLADSFRELADSLKTTGSFDNLSKISSGLVLLSVIDDAKLQVVLDKIKENDNTLKSIYGENSSGLLSMMEKVIHPVQATITPESILSLKTTTDDTEQRKANKTLDEINNKLSQLLDSMNQPSQADSFYK